MSDAPGLLSLIERLEKATGPDRDLDAYIDAAINGRRIDRFSRSFGGDAYYWHSAGGSEVCAPFCNVDRYTASIDAALTLVPEGWEWALFYEHEGYRVEIGDPLRGLESEANEAALALCIASLKARAAPGLSRTDERSREGKPDAEV